MCSPVDSFYFDAQDAQIQELKEQVSSMASQTEQMQTTITQQVSQIQQHKDQYNILKLKLGGFPSVVHCQLVFYVLAKKQTEKKLEGKSLAKVWKFCVLAFHTTSYPMWKCSFVVFGEVFDNFLRKQQEVIVIRVLSPYLAILAKTS